MSGGAAGREVLKWTAAGVDRLRPSRRGVVVLLYHRVGGRTGVQVDLPEPLFERQMAALAARGGVVTLDQGLGLLAEDRPPSRDPVVVTFDDGTDDFADRALPILVRHAIPATLYVSTDHIERRRSFPDDGRPLSWAALADAVGTGLVTVGSHTHTHALLDRVSPAEATDELDRSIGLIEDRLGRRAHHFAYPKAVPGTAAVQDLVRQRFRSAAVGGMRPNRYGRTDPFRLYRSAIQVSDGFRWFARKADGGMLAEDVMRRVLNRRRYAGSTT